MNRDRDVSEGTVTPGAEALGSNITVLVTYPSHGAATMGEEDAARLRRMTKGRYGPAVGMLLSALLAFALTGLPRLSASLVEYFDATGAQESLSAKGPLFIDKLSVSQYTLARPDDSASPWNQSAEKRSDARSDASSSLDEQPRWQRSLVTTAFWHHTNFV